MKKLGQYTNIFRFDFDNGSKNIFLGIKLFFVFQDRKLELSASFRETSQNFNSIRQSIEKNQNNNCLNEIKFCEVS
jgi:hypothetical protein